MATITVTTTADTDPASGYSLRSAIIYAEQNAGTTIDVPAGTYTLAADLPLISQDTQIVGAVGGGTVIDGAGAFRGFLISGIASDGTSAAQTTVGISNVTIQHVLAKGGDGASGGGGGLGAGGAVFVGPAASVTLTNVDVASATAQGGSGGAGGSSVGGGGGGLGGNGGASNSLGPMVGSATGGGGGGLFFAGGASNGRAGATAYAGGGGGGGITSAGSAGGVNASGTASYSGIGGAGLDGYGGGGYGGFATMGFGHYSGGSGAFGGGGGGGGTGGSDASSQAYGGSGGFGGGGGGGGTLNSSSTGSGGSGGFGGGGGGYNGGNGLGGDGGFGGGGGSSLTFLAAKGGFGGGNASGANGDGGGGGGAMGGAIFVAAGGTLTIDGASSETGGQVVAGAGGNAPDGDGAAYDAGIFYEGAPGGAASTLGFGAGNQSIADPIGDLNGAAHDTSTDDGLGGSGGIMALQKSGGGKLTLEAADSYTGGTTIGAAGDSAGSTLALGAAGAAGSGAITFAGSAAAPATLALAAAAQPASGGTFANRLTNLGADDSLDLAGFAYAGTTATAPIMAANGTLTVTEGARSESFTLAGTHPTTYYAESDGSGGTRVTVCYAGGTRIRTARGDGAVEDLRVGDLAVTASGALRPIRWLGHRTIDCRRHPSPREAKPVRISPHAFGENRPARDLFLSPGHSVCVDFFGEVLIPVSRLANGATIAQVDVDEVTYWHIALESHDILLAESLPCESYIDCGTRGFFAESDVVDLTALPDGPALTTDDYCRPFIPEGKLVDFARERLCLRANDLGWRLEVADPLAGLWLEADGQRVVPHCDGLVARITLPAVVRDIVLCSDSAVPADIHGSRDERRLGLQLASVTADDGLHWRREMACTDARLVDGFHTHEGTLRWTDGRARLPSELWEGARDLFVLRLAFAGPALPRWVAPAAAVAAAARSVAA